MLFHFSCLFSQTSPLSSPTIRTVVFSFELEIIAKYYGPLKLSIPQYVAMFISVISKTSLTDVILKSEASKKYPKINAFTYEK